jgi:hypothetical protein
VRGCRVGNIGVRRMCRGRVRRMRVLGKDRDMVMGKKEARVLSRLRSIPRAQRRT